MKDEEDRGNKATRLHHHQTWMKDDKKKHKAVSPGT